VRLLLKQSCRMQAAQYFLIAFFLPPQSKHSIEGCMRHRGQHGHNGGSRQNTQTCECQSCLGALSLLSAY
jgi:hypothetical protein